jgi:hypothetical protein
MSEQRDVNEYLFHEWGVDGDEASISDNWPFELRPVGELEAANVYAFTASGEDFYAFVDGFDYAPQAGMTLADVELAKRGIRWLGERAPVSLEESRPTDDRVPPGVERSRKIRALAGDARVIEGLYLAATGEYVALVDDGAGARAVGTTLPPTPVGFAGARRSWRLGWAVARALGLR